MEDVSQLGCVGQETSYRDKRRALDAEEKEGQRKHTWSKQKGKGMGGPQRDETVLGKKGVRKGMGLLGTEEERTLRLLS